MDKKNIILGLSLILSSVTTLNLASCQNDDDDDANHAPKSAQVEKQKAEEDQNSGPSTSTSIKEDVKNYVSSLGKVRKIHVTVDEHWITICFNADKVDEDAIGDKLDAATKKSGKLTTMIKEVYPKAKHYGTVIAPSGKKNYYMINYKM